MKASGPPRLSLPDFDISPERGFLDEEWFVLVHIEIEAEAGPGLIGLVQAQNAAEDDKEDDVLIGLRMLAAAQEAMRETLLLMPERCDPYIYYSRVRSYIHGWKNSPALPEGVMYAILLMNAMVPAINRVTQPRVFGTTQAAVT